MKVPRRTFAGPGGRTWTAQLFTFPRARATADHARPDAVDAETVLRFTAGELVLDLAEWPSDWVEWPEEQLLALVRRANPPRI